MKIHITGASCTGVTTLGQRVAEKLELPHLDTDAFYWEPTDPPFTSRRPIAERLAGIRAAQGDRGWVLSGSLDGWGDPIVASSDLIVFLTAPTSIRLARLKTRERQRFGARIAPGGDMEAIHASFLVWAAGYDDNHFVGRSRARHESWLAEQNAPVLRLSGAVHVDTLAKKVLGALR